MNRIYVEGREKLFIESLLIKIYGKNYKETIIVIDAKGWQQLELLKQEFEKSINENGRNLIIFDSDSDINGGGFQKRKAEIQDICSKLGYSFKLFLFPNNSDDGDYETLLERLINEKHRILLNCFSEYEKCISTQTNQEGENMYVLPARKAKMYSYVDAFKKSRTKSQKFRNGDWFFDNNEYWTIENNSAIEPLIEFLKTNIFFQ